MFALERGFAAGAARAQWRGYASVAAKAPKSGRAAAKTKNASLALKMSPRVIRPYKPPGQRTPPPPPPPSSSPPPPPSETLSSLWSRSWLPLTGAALLAGALGFYIIGTVAASLKPCPCGTAAAASCEHSTPTGRPPALTGDNAEQFDKELDVPEWWMGITKLRRRLAQRATGHVLELAMGTGRNLEFYNWDGLDGAATSPAAAIASFTGLDISVDMLDVARKRLVKAVPPMASAAPIVRASAMSDHTGGQLSFLHDRLRLIHSDAHRPLPLTATATATAAKYDTVIQTFGLCSVSDPVAVLQNLATVVKPDTGRIILLEHGKGWYGIVNGLLDKNAGKHFDKYGCWWNRDIQGIVEEAAQKTPGLEVVKIERPNILQMGTLVWVELRVTNKTAA